MEDLDFKRIIFASVLAMQYHPRNEVDHDKAVRLSLRATELAAVAFHNYFVVGGIDLCDDDIPF